jgi:hypothetical protein
MLRVTFQTGVEDLRTGSGAGLLADAKRLLRLREELRTEEERLAQQRMQMARQALEGPAERLAVPRDEWKSWFREEAG